MTIPPAKDIRLNADFIALSMVRTKEDILEVNDMLIDLNNDHMSIIAKIENPVAIENLDEIIEVADGIMVARGDMGSEITMSKVPMIQKEIIDTQVAILKQQIANELKNKPEKDSVSTK